MVMARMLGLPCVVKAHGTDINVVARWPSVRPLLAATLHRARFAAGVSRPLVDELVRLGAPIDRAVLLPNGVDPAVFYPQARAEARRALALPERDRIVLYVGGLEPEKGLRELCDAFAALQLSEPAPVHLIAVGEGSLEGELRVRAARLGAGSGRLILAGSQDLAGVARFLGAADLLALPSWAEGTPNVVLEALASGRPVVATRVGGIPDVLADERAGFLVPPRDPRALADALAAALYATWDEDAVLACGPPSWRESAGCMLDVLESVTARPALARSAGPVSARSSAS
jgi:glycosyltransferase involved in cell wall biosynthesis